MKKLNLQKYDYDETPKPPKTGLKSALRYIFTGFLIILFAVAGMSKEKDMLFPSIVAIFGMGCIAFGIFKILKFLWDNIPE